LLVFANFGIEDRFCPVQNARRKADCFMKRGRIGVPGRIFTKLPIPSNLIREAAPSPAKGQLSADRIREIDQAVFAAYAKHLLLEHSASEVAEMLQIPVSFVVAVETGKSHRRIRPLQPPPKLLRT
jgi:hypothetical protein